MARLKRLLDVAAPGSTHGRQDGRAIFDHVGQRAEHLVGPEALELIFASKIAAYSRHGHSQQRHRLASKFAHLQAVLFEKHQHDCTVKLCHVHDLIVARRE
eukprot:2973003-Prymnesium_polylepis.1